MDTEFPQLPNLAYMPELIPDPSLRAVVLADLALLRDIATDPTKYTLAELKYTDNSTQAYGLDWYNYSIRAKWTSSSDETDSIWYWAEYTNYAGMSPALRPPRCPIKGKRVDMHTNEKKKGYGFNEDQSEVCYMFLRLKLGSTTT